MFKKMFLGICILLLSSTSVMANVASWVQPTEYTDGSAISGNDVITVKVFEGTNLVCQSTGTSCSFAAPACDSGLHTYVAKATSSVYNTESAPSAPATWTAPICSKTLRPPTILSITVD